MYMNSTNLICDVCMCKVWYFLLDLNMLRSVMTAGDQTAAECAAARQVLAYIRSGCRPPVSSHQYPVILTQVSLFVITLNCWYDIKTGHGDTNVIRQY